MTEAEIVRMAEELVLKFPPRTTPDSVFLGEQFDRGLAWVQNPTGEGGLGADIHLQALVNEVLAEAGAPEPFEINPIGFGMCAPTIVVWGNAEQRARYLRPLFTGEEIWCQLFSEPTAGSDVAGLATRAVLDGTEWAIAGQKVWTTMAHRATFGLLIARSDSDAVKHAGLTAFVLDMRLPGVDVRPLYQLTGEAEFNEVFLEVRVPATDMLGSVGDGWSVALTTLMNERVSIGGVNPPRGTGPIGHLVEAYEVLNGDDPAEAQAHVDSVVALWIRAEALRLLNIKLEQQRSAGVPGPDGSISKVLAADLNKDIHSEHLNLMGSLGMYYGTYDKVRPETAMSYETPQKAFLRSRANSIEGGTTEVMKNVLAERMLGLPGDVRVDRGVPWKRIPRN